MKTPLVSFCLSASLFGGFKIFNTGTHIKKTYPDVGPH